MRLWRRVLLVAYLLPVHFIDGAFLRREGDRNATSATISAVTNFSASADQSHSGVPTRPARIFFMFMAVDKISNLNVWTQFFSQAPSSQYRAYVHCKLESCKNFVAGTVIIPVATVPSYYCTDLVSPMQQLINFALADDPSSANPADKFAFISDSTLPAKPFSQIYSTLAIRQGSDFCTFPAGEWADVPGTDGLEMAVKVHQWITLNRQHAEKTASVWGAGQWHNFMAKFQMNAQQYTPANVTNTFGDHRNWGCLDEFWHMVALYGPLSRVDASRRTAVNLPLFTNSPLQVGGDVGWQGECDTFVLWAKYLHLPGYNPFKTLHESLDVSSIPHSGNVARPGWWDTISRIGITAIRNSNFLFVRKFIDNPTLAGGGDFLSEYARIVFLM
jgi:hypothetical protein